MKTQTSGQWIVANLMRPMLIAAMMVCLASAVVLILEQILAPWDGSYFLVFCLFAALEGILSERALHRRRITGWEYLVSRSVEAFILILILKFVNYVPQGLEQLRADAILWPNGLEGFFAPLDIVTGLLFLALWVGALLVARLTNELDVTPGKAEPPADITSPEYYIWLTQPPPVRDRSPALASLGELFLWGGIAMLLASALLHLLLPEARTLAPAVLLYFALGLVLLSQARFSVTYTGWQVQGLSIQPGLARRWLLWSLLFMVVVALAALLLPTAYSMGPLVALFTVAAFLYRLLAAFLGLLLYLSALVLSMVFPGVEEPPGMPSEVLPQPGVETPSGAAHLPWLDAVASVLFWIIVAAIIAYAVRRFLRDRLGHLDAEEVGGTWWARLLRWLRGMWNRWLLWGREVQQRFAPPSMRGVALQPAMGVLSRFLSLGRLSPRELIRYYYLSAAKRAAQAGLPRGRDQTPYEYQDDLSKRIPELEPDLSGLTDAFLLAQYSGHHLDEQDVETVKPLWQHVKAILRTRRMRP